MKSNSLFPQIDGFLHGGDYNPEQWLDRPDILKEDIRLMKEAGINVVTLGVFSWAVYEPQEGEFHFDWLKEIMDNLYENGIYTCLATPSGARPAWLDAKYPEAMRCDEMGNRYHHGVRHNHCMTSPEFRKKVEIIDTELAKRFANHPGVLLWHISNEFGGECFCPTCRKRFQGWLADRYEHDINKLNKAWWTTFWSHSYTSFDQIDPPYKNGENCVMGQNLDWRRFTSFTTTEFMNFEIDNIKKVRSDLPFTANFMDMYWGLDYHDMCKNLDIISWDSYPQMHNDFETIQENFLYTAWNHALYRSMKPGQPFMLMESAPGVTNWQRVNKYRRPGFHRLSSLQAVASGSDTVQYFQIRKARGSSEQYHGAVIDHLGTDDTRVFKAVAQLGSLLKDIKEVQGSVSDNKVALLFDWDNRWAIDDAWTLSKDSKKYEDTCVDIWKTMMHMGVEADVVSSDMDWSSYKVIIAPMLYLLHDSVGQKIRDFVEKGGQFMATYFTGYVDKSTLCYLGGFPGQELNSVFGIISEEIDALYPTDRNSITTKTGQKIEVFEYQEMLRLKGADVLATFDGDYIKGLPAITVKTNGEGKAYYVACRTKAKDLAWLFADLFKAATIETKELPDEVEFHSRYNEKFAYDFYLNPSEESKTVAGVSGYDLISKNNFDGILEIGPRDLAIIKRSL